MLKISWMKKKSITEITDTDKLLQFLNYSLCQEQY